MATRFELTSEAYANIDEIWKFIANDKVSAADRVKSSIFAACRRLARNPYIGRPRPEITSLPIRFWPVPRYPSYMIAYRADTKVVCIVAVLDGRRDLPALFKKKPPFP